MRQSFTLFILLLCFLPAKSQQVIFQENFENFQSYQLPGWPQQLHGYPWETGYSDALGNMCFMPEDNKSKVAGVTDTYVPWQGLTCSGTHADSSVLLMTPAISLSGVPVAYLKYDSYFYGTVVNGKTESATIEISTDTGSTWTVLQQVTPDPNGFISLYVDLNAYGGLGNLRLGFRYKDQGEHMSGWMIDNIKVFVPQQHDLALQYVTPQDSLRSYQLAQTGVLHQASVLNYGMDTVSSFSLNYQLGAGPAHSHTFSGLSLAPLSSYVFTHPYPDTVSGVFREKVTMWTELAGDVAHQNDTAYTDITGVAFIPDKLLVVEEGTATWNYQCPKGWVYMNQASLADLNIYQVSVHDADPMEVSDYADYLFNLHWNYIPYFLLDRRRVQPGMFFSELFEQKDHFGFADLDISGNLNGNDLSVDAVVRPAIDLAGDYRLVLVITEDSVRGTSSGYNQRNIYSGGGWGPMGGFENRPDPVPAADMFYNFVARKIVPGPEGTAGVLPQSMQHSNSYTCSFQTTLDPDWNRDRLRIAVMLISMADSSILNSQKLKWFLDIRNPQASFTEAGIYPNPAGESAAVFFRLNQPESLGWTLTDIGGRTIMTGSNAHYPAGRSEFTIPLSAVSNGVYMLTLRSETGKTTLKLQVLH